MVLLRDRMVDSLSADTGQPMERVVGDIDGDYILRGAEAVAYGLVDEIIDRPVPMAIPDAVAR